MKHLLLLCLLLSSFSAFGQSYWEELKAPDGGAPTKITQTVNGWVYAEFYDRAVYCSQDNELHWQQIFWPSNDPDTGFAKITVGRAGTLFTERRLGDGTTPAYFFLDIFKSTDNGVTWQLLVDSLPIHGIAENSDGVLFAMKDSLPNPGTNSSVVRSYDGGATWEAVYTIPEYTFYNTGVVIDEYDRIIVSTWIGAYNVFFSTDDGQSWHKRRRADEFSSLFLVTATGASLSTDIHGYFLRQASDTAAMQEIILDSLPYNYVYGLMLFPDSTIYATASQYFYKSVDDGLTWERIGPHNGYLSFPMGSPLQNGTILAANGYLLGRSDDLGATFTFSTFQINRGLAYDFYTHNDQEWLAWTAGGGLWHTADGGQTWDLRKGGNKKNDNYFNEVLVSDTTGNVWFVMDESLFFTPDLGQTFLDITPPDSLAILEKGIGLNRQTHTLFARTRTGTARSTNNGTTWQTVADSFFLRKMEVHPSGVLFAILDSIYWYPATYASYPFLYRSNDDGQTWERVSVQYVRDFTFMPQGDIYAILDNDIRRSTNLGASWTNLNRSAQHLLSNAGGQLFAQTTSNISMSTDNGINWQTLPLPSVLDGAGGGGSSISYWTLDEESRMYISVWEYGGFGSFGHLFRTTNSTLSGTYLSGTVFKDADADCATNDPESPLSGWVVRADGGDTWYANTDSAGRYTMFLDTGAYFLTVKPTLNILWETCADSLPVQLPDLLDTTEQDVPVRAIADCPYMTVEVAAPWLERCFENYVYVQYCNRGTEPADSAWVDVMLDPYLIFTDTILNYEFLGNNTYRFQLGAVASGQCGNLQLSVYVDCDSTILGQTLCVMAHIFPDSVCIPLPDWSGAEIQVTARCEQDTTLRFEVKNTGTTPSQPLHYFVIEDDVVLMQGDETYLPDESRSFSMPANGHFRRFESEQEPGHPFSMEVAAWAEGCGGFDILGFPNWYFLNNGIPSQDVFCGEIVGAFDPNDKQGFPQGYGSERLVPPNTDIEYLVRFQNTGTAPAHNVVIRDTLSPSLDPSSLRMGTASHPFTWALDGQGFLTVTFSDINLPDSNSNEAASHGFFSFKISQKPDLPDGTDIHNTASIYFDFNGAIRTNETLHRIGRDFITVDVDKIPDPSAFNIRVSPNPVTETAMLTFEGLGAGEYQFRMANVAGKILREMTFDGNTLTLRREGLASGVYFFQIMGKAGKRVGSGKVLMR